MPLQPGTKLGPYEVVAPVAGAMDLAYKASDTRQNRSVTLRTLPTGFAGNVEIKDRFDRETKTIAALNHPHICAPIDTIHDEDGVHYFVTEYLEGETLAARLMKGPLEIDEALRIAIAIADALDKAHRRGIAHRGLSPSNVMLTPKGAKLLDFGLANLREPAQTTVSASELATRTASLPAMGVPAAATRYLTPEQLEGTEAGPRADIFAFGAILYEMVTGKPAFEGKTQALLVAAIATADPEPPSTVQALVPPEIDFIVARCLAKAPAQRLQTAWDLLCQLQWIAEGGSQIGISVPVAAKRRKRDRAVRIAALTAAFVAVILAPAAFLYFRGTTQPEEIRFTLANMGESGGGVGVTSPSISPNGRFVSASRGTRPGLDLIPLGSGAPQILFPDNTIWLHFWSPDSKSVAFFEDGKIKKGDISGGPTQIVCETAMTFGGGTWSREGVIIYAAGGILYRVLAAGGQATAITSLDSAEQETEHVAPVFLPDGRHYLYLALSSKPTNDAVYVGSLDSKERKRLFPSNSRAVYAAPGYLFFNRGNSVFAQPFDADKLALSGEAVRLADGVPQILALPGASPISTSMGRNGAFAVSQAGVLLYRTGATGAPVQGQRGNITDLSLIWFDRTGRRTGAVGTAGVYAGVDLSPDGKHVVVHRHETEGGDDWILDAAQGPSQRLTFDTSQDNSMPVWSPDGTRIAFGSKRAGKWGLYLKLADGTASEELLTESELPKAPMSWSPDGKMLVYEVIDPKTHGDVWAVPLTGDRKPIAILQSQFDEQMPQVSADGKWIAYQSDETDTPQIYVKPFPAGAGKWQVSTDRGVFPRWRRDGKELFFWDPPNVTAVDIAVVGSSIKSGTPHTLFGTGNPNSAHATPYLRYAVSADGQRFLFPQPGGGPVNSGGLADAIINAVDNPQTANTGANATTVVLNWTRMLKQK